MGVVGRLKGQLSPWKPKRKRLGGGGEGMEWFREAKAREHRIEGTGIANSMIINVLDDSLSNVGDRGRS